MLRRVQQKIYVHSKEFNPRLKMVNPIRVAITSGFFDPMGVNHVELFKSAKGMSTYHIVGVNSDACSLRKKGQECFLPFEHRKRIIESLRCVDEVVSFDDIDGTACSLIADIHSRYESEIKNDQIVLMFCNGGDRTKETSPEQEFVDKHLNGEVYMMYGVGGTEKIASSSECLKNWVLATWKRYNGDLNGVYKDNKY